MIRNLLSMVLAALLAGCASIQLPGSTPDIQTLDNWLDKHQYGRVITAVDQVPQTHPDYVHYVARRTAAEQLAKQYETSVLAGIRDEEKEQDWASAIVQIDEALSNYPQSQALKAKRAKLSRKQQHRTRKLNAEALLTRTRWLENELPLMRKRAKDSPVDISLHWSIGQLEDEMDASVDKLIMTATELFEYDEYDLIEKCLDRATELGSSKEEQNTITLLQERVDTRRAEIRRRQLALQKKRAQRLESEKHARHQQKIEGLVAETYSALDKNDLYTAQNLANELGRLSPDDSDVKLLKEKIRILIKDEVDKMTAQGNSLYRQEKIAEAKSVWESALRLDPDNRGLKTNIERASRVLNKLENLRNKQKAF